MRRHGAWSLALVALATRIAAAQTRFEVPQGCGTEADFRRELAALVGGAAQETLPAALEISEQPEGHFRLRLELPGEVREIADADCRTLFRSAVVIAAAAARGVEPEPPALPEPAEPEPPPPAASETPAAGVEPARPVEEEQEQLEVEPPGAAVDTPQSPSAPSKDLRPSKLALGAGIGLSAGTVPSASAVLEARAGLDPAPFGLALSARYWPGSGAESDGRRVHVTAVGGRVAALVELGSALHASLGLEVDRLSGTGQEGVSGRSSDTVWLLAGALELNVIPWSVDDLRLELGFGTQLALVRPRFVVDGYGDVYEVPPVGGGAIIRAVWLFP